MTSELSPSPRRPNRRWSKIALGATGVGMLGVAGIVGVAEATADQSPAVVVSAASSKTGAGTPLAVAPDAAANSADDDAPSSTLPDFDELLGGVGDLSECLGFGDVFDELFSDENLAEFENLFDDLFADLDGADFAGEVGRGDDLVAVMGDGGPQLIELGDGGKVTIESVDGELVIDTSGDATVTPLDELLEEFIAQFEEFDLGAFEFGDFEFGDFEFGDFEFGDFEFGELDDEMPGLPNEADIAACL